MSEVESISDEERKRRAEARLAASRPAREAAAAAHAHTMAQSGGDNEGKIIRKSLAEIAANPRRFTEAERARLLAMTEEEIEAAALVDPDNPPWTDEELAEARRARDERLAKEKRRA